MTIAWFVIGLPAGLWIVLCAVAVLRDLLHVVNDDRLAG
jgi:hypothetical protein